MVRDGVSILAAGIVAVTLAACGGSQTAPSAVDAVQQGFARPDNISTGIEFDNKWKATTFPAGYTQIGCPWAVTQPPYPVSPGGSQHTVLVYNNGCTPNEPMTWYVSYGTNVHHSETVCTWTVTYTGAATFAYKVENTSRTKCTFARSGLIEHFYYDLRRRR